MSLAWSNFRDALRRNIGPMIGSRRKIEALQKALEDANAAIARLAPIEAEPDRWREISPIIDGIFGLDPAERQILLSGVVGG